MTKPRLIETASFEAAAAALITRTKDMLARAQADLDRINNKQVRAIVQAQVTPRPLWECLRCGNKWFGRVGRKPKICSNRLCQSRYWDRPRRTDPAKHDPTKRNGVPKANKARHFNQ